MAIRYLSEVLPLPSLVRDSLDIGHFFEHYGNFHVHPLSRFREIYSNFKACFNLLELNTLHA